jgi:hypothetical protein
VRQEATMTEQCGKIVPSDYQDAAVAASESFHVVSSKTEPPQLEMGKLNIARKMTPVNALRAASLEKSHRWKEISAEYFESIEMTTTLKHILEDYGSHGDGVSLKSRLMQNDEQSVSMLGSNAYERIHHKLCKVVKQTNFTECLAEIPDFKATKFSCISSAQKHDHAKKETKLQLHSSKDDVKVMREENWDKAIWKASAVRPSSAFERKLKRLTALGSDNLPPPIPIGNTKKEVSRWPTTSTSHHSEFGASCASHQTQILRNKSPHASKVLGDILLAKDRSHLYNEVKDLLLTRLQELPEEAVWPSCSYAAVFFEALRLLADGLTSYKPLLQAILSELKSVFEVQNECEQHQVVCC